MLAHLKGIGGYNEYVVYQIPIPKGTFSIVRVTTKKMGLP